MTEINTQIEPALKTAATINRTAGDWLRQFSPYGVFTTDKDLVVTGWNQWMAIHSQMRPEAAVGRDLLDICPDLVERKMDRFFRAALLGQTVVLSHRLHEHLISMKPGPGGKAFTHMPQSATISPLHQNGNVMGIIVYIEDVSERVQRERELEDHITELQATMKQVKTLKGLLPICSYCKNIRDDKGYWSRLEAYFGEHANVDFSHSICPACAKKHFPDMDLFEDEQVRSNKKEADNGKNTGCR